MPEERVSRLVMGKLHISQWVREELGERIEKLILSGDEYLQEKGKGKGKFTWVFGDGIVETIDNEKIIFGRFWEFGSCMEIRRGCIKVLANGKIIFKRNVYLGNKV